MQTMTLAAASRTKKAKAAKHLLPAGRIPAVLYGHGVDNRSIEVESVPFRKVLNAAGESSLVDLTVDGGSPTKVLIHDLQFDPLKDTVTHIDFLQVNMKEKIMVDIPLVFTGEAMAVKGLGGTLVKNHDSLQVECLPGDLVNGVDVDLDQLKQINDALRVSDLYLPQTIKVLTHPDEQIARVTYASLEEITTEKPEVAAEVEVVEKGKKEEEGEEGAPAAPAPKKEKEEKK